MSLEQIAFLRDRAIRLRDVAATLEGEAAIKLRSLADSFELKADELEAAARFAREIC
jgi:hypothetical protein